VTELSLTGDFVVRLSLRERIEVRVRVVRGNERDVSI
jgi:hypothetical protein